LLHKQPPNDVATVLAVPPAGILGGTAGADEELQLPTSWSALAGMLFLEVFRHL
jgi:hypothetical protein